MCSWCPNDHHPPALEENFPEASIQITSRERNGAEGWIRLGTCSTNHSHKNKKKKTQQGWPSSKVVNSTLYIRKWNSHICGKCLQCGKYIIWYLRTPVLLMMRWSSKWSIFIVNIKQFLPYTFHLLVAISRKISTGRHTLIFYFWNCTLPSHSTCSPHIKKISCIWVVSRKGEYHC